MKSCVLMYSLPPSFLFIFHLQMSARSTVFKIVRFVSSSPCNYYKYDMLYSTDMAQWQLCDSLGLILLSLFFFFFFFSLMS